MSLYYKNRKVQLAFYNKKTASMAVLLFAIKIDINQHVLIQNFGVFQIKIKCYVTNRNIKVRWISFNKKTAQELSFYLL